MAKEIIILSPITGKVKDLTKVSDEVFSQKMVGDGVAVTPAATSKEVVSPIKGKAETVFSTGHAYGIKGKKEEVLVHIGIDTVTLEGEGFETKISQGDKVKAGQEIANVDIKTIKAKAPSTDTMVLITNIDALGMKVEVIAEGNVEAGQPLFKLVK